MELVKVRTEDRDLLWNINQKYLYEMTNYYDDEMDMQGNLHYGYFDDYFTELKHRLDFLCLYSIMQNGNCDFKFGGLYGYFAG